MTSKPVGYGNPPAHSRIKKGQSGNPKRPAEKGRRPSAEDLEGGAGPAHPGHGGRSQAKRITKQRGVAKSLAAGAIKGNTRAAALIAKLCAEEITPEVAAGPASLSPAEQKLVEDYLEREAKRRAAKLKEGRCR